VRAIPRVGGAAPAEPRILTAPPWAARLGPDRGGGLTRHKKVSRLVTMRANLAGEIRATLAAAPCSLRALARAASVSHGALVRIRRGTLFATPTVAVKLAEALELWGAGCQRAAKRLRAAARRVPNRTGRKL